MNTPIHPPNGKLITQNSQLITHKVRRLWDSIIPFRISPKDALFPLQRKFIDDAAQYKIAVTTRQWGKSHLTAGEAVHDCLKHPGTLWVCMSAGERQSLEWKAWADVWVRAYKVAIHDVAELRDGRAEGLLRSAEIQFANGSRIIAIPSNPSTARGYSANIILDEFAYHESPDAVWAAMFPSTANELSGTFLQRYEALLGNKSPAIRRPLKLRVVSTFNGRGNKFYDLWEKADKNGYSKHFVTIHDAVADGMPLDPEKLRSALDDPDIWAQEFECMPMDASAVLLPYDVIARCESPEATTVISPEFYHISKPPIYIGWDFARKQDLSVLWIAEKMGDVLHTREVVEFRNMSTPDQINAVRHRIKAAQKVCLDYTGSGVGCGDFLAREFGQYSPQKHQYGKIELCAFSNALKVEVFSKLRMAFDSVKIRVPVNREVREDLHSVNRVVTQTGTVTYRAPRNEDGHADRCTALALCLRASDTYVAMFAPRVFDTPYSRIILERRRRHEENEKFRKEFYGDVHRSIDGRDIIP